MVWALHDPGQLALRVCGRMACTGHTSGGKAAEGPLPSFQVRPPELLSQAATELSPHGMVVDGLWLVFPRASRKPAQYLAVELLAATTPPVQCRTPLAYAGWQT
jgi:hypothetical protein